LGDVEHDGGNGGAGDQEELLDATLEAGGGEGEGQKEGGGGDDLQNLLRDPKAFLQKASDVLKNISIGIDLVYFYCL
jgi:hypothetical protein